MSGRVLKRLADLGLALPKASPPVANYIPCRRSGSHLYISGQIPFTSNGLLQGRLGENVSVEEGQEAARHCVLNMCAQVDLAVGLDAVKTVLKVEGFVNTTPDFGDHPEVVNGASDLLVEIFGKDVGQHSRYAVGCSSLPRNVPVEVGFLLELHDSKM
jgi:enamine deaminase RidA (YjgF/YER057c/UK114 family)